MAAYTNFQTRKVRLDFQANAYINSLLRYHSSFSRPMLLDLLLFFFIYLYLPTVRCILWAQPLNHFPKIFSYKWNNIRVKYNYLFRAHLLYFRINFQSIYNSNKKSFDLRRLNSKSNVFFILFFFTYPFIKSISSSCTSIILCQIPRHSFAVDASFVFLFLFILSFL